MWDLAAKRLRTPLNTNAPPPAGRIPTGTCAEEFPGVNKSIKSAGLFEELPRFGTLLCNTYTSWTKLTTSQNHFPSCSPSSCRRQRPFSRRREGEIYFFYNYVLETVRFERSANATTTTKSTTSTTAPDLGDKWEIPALKCYQGRISHKARCFHDFRLFFLQIIFWQKC